MQNYKYNEREVIILDYICNLLKQWKRILFSMVIFAIFFGTVKYMLDKKTIQEEIQNNQNQRYDKDDVLEQVEMLPLAEKQDVETAIKLKDLIESEMSYSQNARIMQLDSNSVSKEILQYYVESDDNAAELLEYYSNCIFSEDVKESMVAVSDNQMKDTDVEDIITTEIGRSPFLTDSNIVVEEKALCLYITVRGIDKAISQKIVQVIEESINTSSINAQKFYGTHSIKLVNRSSSQGRDEDVDKLQKDIYASIYNISSQIKQLTASMNENQLQIIQLYNIAINSDENETGADVVFQNPSVNKKWILLGAFFGLFLVAVIEGLKWLLGEKLYSVEEWEQNFQIYTYGIIGVSTKGNSMSVMDKWISKLKNRNQTILPIQQQHDMTCSRIVMSAKSEQIKKIYMISSEFMDLGKLETATQLQQKANEEGIDIILGENIFQNRDSFVKMLEVGHVVLLEEIGISEYQKILQVLQICNEYHVKVMGSVILEQ